MEEPGPPAIAGPTLARGRADHASGGEPFHSCAPAEPERRLLATPDLLIAGVQPLVAQPEPHDQPDEAGLVGPVEPVGRAKGATCPRSPASPLGGGRLRTGRRIGRNRHPGGRNEAGVLRHFSLGSHRDRRSSPVSGGATTRDEPRASYPRFDSFNRSWRRGRRYRVVDEERTVARPRVHVRTTSAG